MLDGKAALPPNACKQPERTLVASAVQKVSTRRCWAALVPAPSPSHDCPDLLQLLELSKLEEENSDARSNFTADDGADAGGRGMRPSEVAVSGLRRTAGNLPRDEPNHWWQRAVIYEIATVSFQDSDGDGKGDLAGLLSRTDYLEWLGIDAVWLTPIFPSPMLDFGYDIADFCQVDPALGTLAQFDRLVQDLHQRDIRLILDFVPNHTSDQHPWFKESRSSRANLKRAWYIWADPRADGGPPNNWQSRFGGSAWQWDEATGQYYYHTFLRQQPDLNWRNADVRAAMADVLRFWMRRGVDGFRVDASAVLAKDKLLRDNPPDPEAADKPPPQRFRNIFTDDRPEAMSYLAHMREVIDEFEDRVLCGEVQGKTDRIGHFYGDDKPRLHLPLNFVLLDSQWDAISLQANIDAYFNAIPEQAWPDWVIGGHDKHRIASKLGPEQTRVLAMLLLTLKGTPFLYAGDELGMERVPIPPDRITDPFEKLVPGYDLNRDPERVPMRWDASNNGGFSEGEPWLPMGPAVAEQNVVVLQGDDRSLLWLFKRLIALRRNAPALATGAYIPLRSQNDIVAYKRAKGDDSYLIALNLVHEPRRLEWEGEGHLILSSHLDDFHARDLRGPVILRPDEGIIVKLASINT
jgi:alpha-glucosidase